MMNFSILPLDNWGDHLDEIVAPAMTFMELCEKHDIKHIDFLQIDTEGYDAQIIKSIDFSKVDIDILKYERWEFPAEFFSRHGEDSVHYGSNGMREIEDILNKNNYTIIESWLDNTAIKNK
jgi:hypothetical protein